MTAGDSTLRERTLILPYEILRTLHYGVGVVRLHQNRRDASWRVTKYVSLLGREDNLVVAEAVLLREVDHLNVAGVIDVAEVDDADPALGLVAIVMPYYQRGSVHDALDAGQRFRPGEARDIAVRALRGLAHLHDQHRVLHRDIKPSNLFLAEDGSVVKVGDLGEAVRMEEDGTAPPLVTPQFWTAPETFTGSRHTTGADVYAMGMSLMELLNGPFPYIDYNVNDLAHALAQGRPAVRNRDLAFQPHIADSLRRITRKAIRRQAGERYATADEMAEALLRARFIDWSWPEIGEDRAEWVADGYRVIAGRSRRGWRVRVEAHHRSGWRKVAQSPEPVDEALRTAADRAFRWMDRFVVNT